MGSRRLYLRLQVWEQDDRLEAGARYYLINRIGPLPQPTQMWLNRVKEIAHALQPTGHRGEGGAGPQGQPSRPTPFDPELMSQIDLQPDESGEQVVLTADGPTTGPTTHDPTDEELASIRILDEGESLTVEPRTESPRQDMPRGLQAHEEAAMPRMVTEPEEEPNVFVAVRRAALEAGQRHAGEHRDRETGGLLLGKIARAKDGRAIVIITGIVRAPLAVGQFASVAFTPEAWCDMWRKIDRDPDYRDDNQWSVVGWYHTHPSFGIFLSNMDLDIHRGHFAQPGHLALVIDPVRNEWGIYGWTKEMRDVTRCRSGGALTQWDDSATISGLRKIVASLATLPAAEIGLEEEMLSDAPAAPEASRQPAPVPDAASASAREQANDESPARPTV